MRKKNCFILVIFVIGILLSGDTFADSVKVENVFVDITTEYKYYHELQTLYDKGMIFPDQDGKFAPYDLLSRDEFVGIASEVSCRRCIQPNVEIDFLNKYTEQPFFDIPLGNKYFYCISDAKANNFVRGYDANTRCDDGTFQSGANPFCGNNTIILEEALAVVMRMSGILTNEEAEARRQDIRDGKITKALSDDVKPTNLDGSVYSFYPDFEKALDYEIVEYDTNGNKKTYYLIQKTNNKLRPKKSITKEEFLKIAYVALKANSCIATKENNLALKMNIFDKTCNIKKQNCRFSPLKDANNIYDFAPEVGGECSLGIRNPEGYIWRFYNLKTGKQIKKYGKYIDNHELVSDGKRKVFLRVIDNCGNTSEVYNTLVVGGNNLKVNLRAEPIIGDGPLKVDLVGVASFGEPPYRYDWTFGDTKKGLGRIVTNIYGDIGIYEVILSVEDSEGSRGNANAFIKVLNNKCEKDSDIDGINDCDDLCPIVKGVKENSGCPILEKQCKNPSDCSDGYTCKVQKGGIGICLPLDVEESCVYDGGSVLFGNAIINSCPSNISFDFRSSLRKCDKVFPAIVSPDAKTIYTKGSVFEIR